MKCFSKMFKIPFAFCFSIFQRLYMKWCLMLLCLLLQTFLQAQPYIDVAAVRYQQSPDGGVLRRNFNQNGYRYAQAAVNLPLVLKDSSIVLVSPALEWWHLESNAMPQLPQNLYGMALPVAYVKPLRNNWTGTLLVVQRWNGSSGFNFNDRYQLGGAVLLARKKSEALTYKFGLYYNREFFGHFFMPLAGIDWQVSLKLRLFGVLPGNLVLEKKASPSFYYGASFRATTTSYRFPNGANRANNFVRIEDNTLQSFADYYLTKNIVLNAEAGHSFFRRYRIGTEAAAKKYFMEEKFNDNWLFRLSLLYRMRFDGRS